MCVRVLEAGGSLVSVQHMFVVETIELLQEDECEHSVRSQTSIVRCETLPQAEETFLTHDLG